MQMGAAGNEQRREMAFGFASGCSDGRREADGSAAPLAVRQVAVHACRGWKRVTAMIKRKCAGVRENGYLGLKLVEERPSGFPR